jgi:hypothetical protein
MGEVVQFVRRDEPVGRLLADWRYWQSRLPRSQGVSVLGRVCEARQAAGAAFSRMPRHHAVERFVAAFPGVTRQKAARQVGFAISCYRMHLRHLEAAA